MVNALLIHLYAAERVTITTPRTANHYADHTAQVNERASRHGREPRVHQRGNILILGEDLIQGREDGDLAATRLNILRYI